MSIFSAIGSVLKKVAPVAAFIPGVGPLAAGGLALGGSVLGDAIDGGGINLGGDLLNGGLAAGGSALLGGKGINGLGALLKGGASLPKVPIMDAAGNIVGYNAAGGSGGGLLDTILHNRNLLPLLAGGAGALSAAGHQSSADRLREEALDNARGEYASKAPLRDRALGILTGAMPGRPDLSALRDTRNPYAAEHTLSLPTGPVAGLPMPPVAPAASPSAPPGVQNLVGALGGLASRLPAPPTANPSAFQTVVNRLAVPKGATDATGTPLTRAQFDYAQSHRRAL